jgi:hypothetical protein
MLARWLRRNHVALLGHHDPAQARRRLERAATLAGETGQAELGLLIHACEGLLLITEGELPDGMRRLDEASAAAAAGELTDQAAVETVCCE